MKEGKNIKTRQSNFELMRIISMFMIVLWHCISHTNILERTGGNLNLLLELIFMFTAVHVNSFILLSGYFGYKNEFNIKKLFATINSVWFYKAIYALIFVGLGLVTMSYFDLFLFLTPLNYSYSFGTFYWFINVYIVLYVLTPFINKFIKNLDKKQFRKLLILLFFFLSIIPFITNNQVIDNNGYQISSFIMLYLIGAYFGKYKLKDNYHFKNYSKNKRQFILIVLLFLILMLDFFMLMTSSYLENNSSVFFTYVKSIIDCQKIIFSSPIIIFESLIYLLLFETFDFKSKFINNVSKLMFGVYLVHENLFVYNHIYKYLPLGTSGELYGKSVIVILFLMAIGIFIGSVIIEWFRQLLFNLIGKTKLAKNISNKFYDYIKAF